MGLVAANFSSEEESSNFQFQQDELFNLRRKRILVIEEDWDFSQLLSQVLISHLDVEVEIVKSPYQALSRMTHEVFDAVIMENKLNPYQALIEAEQFLEPVLEGHFPEVGKIPVVVITADASSVMDGLESHYFRIVSTVVRQGDGGQTALKVEDELNDLLDF